MTPANVQREALERNRRESYRINDRVGLYVQALSESDYVDARAAATGRFEMRRTLNSIIATGDAQRGALRNIRDSDPALAAYLQNIEDRLESLVRLLSLKSTAAPGTPSHDVNISGNGIRFRHEKRMPRGSKVRIELQLFPSRTCLSLLGTVVRCSELEQPAKNGDRHVIAVDFTDIHDDDRELLIRHVHSLQLEHARRGVLR